MLREVLERRRRALEVRRRQRELDRGYQKPRREDDPRLQSRVGGYGSSPAQSGRRWAMRLVPILIAVAVIGFNYFSAETFVNPVTGEMSRVALSPQQEERLGLQSFQKVLSENRVISSGPEYEMVVRVARRLAEATGDHGDDFDWQVALIDSPQRNAFCLPGGKIAFFTGILPICANEDGVAAVMGHEMAHAIGRHAAQRMFRHQQIQTLLGGVQGSMADLDPSQQRVIMGMLGAGAQYGFILPFSRDHETEADEMGLLYAARAGYDPRAAIGLWERMAQAGGPAPPEFASTHPSHGTRIRDLQRMMPRAMEIAQKARREMGLPPLPQHSEHTHSDH